VPSRRKSGLHEFLRHREEALDFSGIFGRLSKPNRDRFYTDITTGCKIENFQRGQTLILGISVSQPVYLIHCGQVKLTQLTIYGNAVTDYRGPGEFVGEVDGLLDHSAPRTTTATATEEVTAWRIPAERFRAYVIEHSAVAAAIIDYLATRVHQLERYRNLHKGKVLERLAQRLLDLGLASQPGVTLAYGFSISTTQAELANSVGATLSAVEAEMRTLREAKIITTVRGIVNVLNPAYLVELLDTADIDTPIDYHQRFVAAQTDNPNRS
jgi:CRP-like cAMP-binding protein